MLLYNTTESLFYIVCAGKVIADTADIIIAINHFLILYLVKFPFSLFIGNLCLDVDVFEDAENIFRSARKKMSVSWQAYLYSIWILFLYMEIHFPYNLKFYHLYSNFSVLDRRSERIFVSGNKRSDTEVINGMPVITCAHMLSYMKDYFYRTVLIRKSTIHKTTLFKK